MAIDPALLARLNVRPEELRVVRPARGLAQRVYIVEIVRGLAVTFRHLVRNLFDQKGMPTSRVPEVRRTLPEGFRGRHRLTQKERGTGCGRCGRGRY